MIEIRTPLPAETEQWLPLWQGYNEFYEINIPSEITDLTWERFHNPEESTRILAAYESGVMVGFSAFLFHRSTWAKNYYCYLEDLFVSKEFRKRGIAEQLIKAVVEAAKKNGASRVYWVTREGNSTARPLYNKLAALTDYIQYRIDI